MLIRRLKYWLDSTRRGEALREETELHLAERAAELEADGMTPEDARAEARRRFGNLGLMREKSREVWVTRFWSELSQDIGYGCRTMLANKAFTAMAILSLALGIGANTAIYSLMEAILLRSLPVAHPESLVVLNWQSPMPQNANKQWVHVMHGLQGRAWPSEKGVLASGMFPYRAFEMLGEDNADFSSLFGYFDGRKHNVTVRGYATSSSTEYVTGQYFQGLGVSSAAGRLIGPEDDRAGAAPVAVISHPLSQNRFGGPVNAIGQSILVDNTPFTVVGVSPPEFFGVDPSAAPDLYLPMHTNLLVDKPRAEKLYEDDNFYWIEMMGRLRPGVSMAQAQAALAPRFHRWVATTATSEAERAKLPALTLNPGAAGLSSLRRRYSKPLFVLLAMVALILAIACANIANLLLARAAARRREIAVRLSLGAGRLRLVRQLLVESVLLALVGGACGILFAIWGVRWLTVLLPRGQENFTVRAESNWNVLAVTVALSVVCGLLFGLAPAIQATRPHLTRALKDGGPAGSRRRGQHVLVIAQIALSFFLLVAAGLFVRTLNNLQSIQLGYTREHILLFSVNAHQTGHRDPEMITFYDDLRKRFASMPGVSSATLSQSSIVDADVAGGTYMGKIKIGAGTVLGAGVMAVGPQFLTTMQIPLLAGREIGKQDQTGSPPAAVITERLAHTYFGNVNPIGQRITFVDDNRDLEIVGVSGNIRYGNLKQGEKAMTVFVAATQFPPERVTYALRAAGDPLSYVKSVYEIVHKADSRVPVTNSINEGAEIDRTISQEITFAKLCTTFAALALLMACVGLYGTMSYNVAPQVTEIGTRMALGAQRGTVVWMVLRRALVLAALGLAVSVPASLIGSRLVESLLFDTQPNDPKSLTLAAAVLLIAALVSGYAPAWRASRIDPLAALRQE